MSSDVTVDSEVCFNKHNVIFSTRSYLFVSLQEYQNFGWWVGEKNGNIGIVPKDYLIELYAL